MKETEETPRPLATPEFGHVEAGGPAHVYPDADGMRVTKFSVGNFDNNVYIIHCIETGDALIVDGAADPKRILKEVADSHVIGILQTHGHPDHVQALPKLVATLDVPVYAHPDDRVARASVPLTGDETFTVGNLEVRAMYTPGHTPGSVSFIAGAFLFSGDTLFPGGPGNTNGDARRFTQVMASLEQMFALPDETRVLPGHGLDTTIGRERPHVETWRARGW